MKKLKIILFLITLFPSLTLATSGINQTNNFLTISDIHYNHNAEKVTYGQDTGKVLFQEAFKKIKVVITKTKPKFIIFLGDLPAHLQDYQNREEDDKAVLQALAQVAVKTPLFYVPGNNDSLKGDYHAFSTVEGTNILSLLPKQSWPAINTLPNCNNSTKQACIISHPNQFKYGFYSAYPLGKANHLRLIVLNSVIFSPWYKDNGLISQQQLAQKQLQWLQQQLQAAARNKDAVILAMHIPPGKDSYAHKNMWVKASQEKFLNLIDQFHNTIRAILVAHIHFDGLRLILNGHNQFIDEVLFTPSVSPIYGNNPGFKAYYYSRQGYDIVASKLYYTNPNSLPWGNLAYVFNDAILSALRQARLDVLKQRQYADFRSHYNPSQGWQSIDSATIIKE